MKIASQLHYVARLSPRAEGITPPNPAELRHSPHLRGPQAKFGSLVGLSGARSSPERASLTTDLPVTPVICRKNGRLQRHWTLLTVADRSKQPNTLHFPSLDRSGMVACDTGHNRCNHMA